jgi:hypothetical protein
MPTEVLKRSVKLKAPEFPLYVRDLRTLIDKENSQFGCPMLTRSQVALPLTGNQPPPRCSMGWAVHGESEVKLCAHTPDMLACWKQGESYLAAAQERIRQEEEQLAAAD